jgi:hypothetical protein
MAEIAVVDNKDGTGATFTITNVVGTASLYTAGYFGNVATNTFVKHFDTALDRVQSVSIPVGSYAAVVVDGAGPAAPVGFRVTDGNLGFHEKCLREIRNHMMGLNLSSFPTDPGKYKLHKRPANSYLELKDVCGSNILGVHFWKRPEQRPVIGTNTEWDISYVIEMVLVKSNQLSNLSDSNWTLDRERILRSFGICPLPAIPEIFLVEFYPGVLYNDVADVGVDAQAIQFYCRMYQPVTYGV